MSPCVPTSRGARYEYGTVFSGRRAQRYDTFYYTLFVSTLRTLEVDIYILARASTCVLKV